MAKESQDNVIDPMVAVAESQNQAIAFWGRAQEVEIIDLTTMADEGLRIQRLGDAPRHAVNAAIGWATVKPRP